MSYKLFQACVSLLTLLFLFALSDLNSIAQERNSDPQVIETAELRSEPPATDSIVADVPPSDAKTDSEDENNHQDEQAPGVSDEPVRQRIIDPRQIETKDSLPARIAQAPFRFLAPRINSGLTRLENQQGMGRLALILNNPSIRPTFGGLGDGSGFGAGVYLSTANRLSENYKLFFSAHATMKSYVETLAGAEFTPKNFAGGRMRFDLVGRYRLRPQENFWGTGTNSSRSDRATYRLSEQGVRAESSVRVARPLRVGALVDYSSSTVTNGRSGRFAGVGERFGVADLPGFGSRVALFGAGFFAEYEGRDQPANPHAGFYARVAATSNDSVGRGDYGFVNYSMDARGYVPLGTKRRTLALRLLGDFNDAKGGSDVPLFRLARLGDSETLRGYATHRFHGRNAVHGTIEYRYQLASSFEPGGLGGIEAVAFTDAGQVFNNRREFSLKNLRATWGGGLQFASQRSALFRVLYARSPEGGRVMFSFGPSF
ncbi:MAG TPA: BamA/TamA family outer membrane protein [Pyrinomonadaceae bacterium]|nr:BamA/TamA family outer membrane protein [Pyrinomonadaceae bacterium]